MGNAGDLDNFLGRLEATFDAQVARAEDEAASDLAFSLRQGRNLRQRIERCACEVWVDEGWHPVSAIGPDVLVVGDPIRYLLPMRHASLRAGDGEPPRSAAPWLSILRNLAREGHAVEILADDGCRAAGRLLAAATDHLFVDGSRGWAAVGTAGIRRIRLVRGD